MSTTTKPSTALVNTTALTTSATDDPTNCLYCEFDRIHKLFLFCLGVLTITINLFVIFIYSRSKTRIHKKTSNVLLCNQAVVDLFHGAVTNSVTLYGSSFIILKHSIYQFSLALSLHTVILVSFERYLFITRPLRHRKTLTYRRTIYAVLLSWTSSLLWIPFRLVHFMDDSINWKKYTHYYIVVTESIIFIIIVFVTYSYIASYRAIKKFLKRKFEIRQNTLRLRTRISDIRSDICSDVELSVKKNREEMRITQIFFGTFIVFLISYLPVFINGFVHISVLSTTYTPLLSKLMSLDLTFYLLSCFVNPFVTLVFKEDFRRTLLSCLRCACVKLTRVLFTFCMMTELDNDGEQIGQYSPCTPTLSRFIKRREIQLNEESVQRKLLRNNSLQRLRK